MATTTKTKARRPAAVTAARAPAPAAPAAGWDPDPGQAVRLERCRRAAARLGAALDALQRHGLPSGQPFGLAHHAEQLAWRCRAFAAAAGWHAGRLVGGEYPD